MSDAPAKEGGGKRKFGYAGTTVPQAVQEWQFYKRMSFYNGNSMKGCPFINHTSTQGSKSI